MAEQFFVGGEDPVAHYAAIGRFIVGFSKLEVTVHTLYTELIDLPIDVIRTLLDGMQLPQLLAKLPEVAKACGNPHSFSEKFHPLRETIEQLWAVRSRVAHQPFMRTETDFLFSDAFWKPTSKIKDYRCSVAQLNTAASFMGPLSEFLRWIFPRFDPRLRGKPPEFDVFFRSTLQALREKQNLPPKVTPGSPDDHIQLTLIRYLSSLETQSRKEEH